jgi:hypothetical protein
VPLRPTGGRSLYIHGLNLEAPATLEIIQGRRRDLGYLLSDDRVLADLAK